MLSTANEVLISGHDCGALPTGEVSETDGTQSVEPFMQYMTQLGIDSFSYATQCYGKTRIQRAGACNTFTQATLPFKADKNASCPFGAEICESNTGNLLLESSNLDSFAELGLNVNPRFTLRAKTHCAPLRTQGYTEIITDGDSGRRYLIYKYGSQTQIGDDIAESFVYKYDLDKDKALGDGESWADYRIT